MTEVRTKGPGVQKRRDPGQGGNLGFLSDCDEGPQEGPERELLFHSCHRTDSVFSEEPSGCFGESTLDGEFEGAGQWPGPGWWAQRWESHMEGVF